MDAPHRPGPPGSVGGNGIRLHEVNVLQKYDELIAAGVPTADLHADEKPDAVQSARITFPPCWTPTGAAPYSSM